MRPVETPRGRREDNIKKDLMVIGWGEGRMGLLPDSYEDGN
jgi:hypothetical protein